MNVGKSLLCPVLVWEEGHPPTPLFQLSSAGGQEDLRQMGLAATRATTLSLP